MNWLRKRKENKENKQRQLEELDRLMREVGVLIGMDLYHNSDRGAISTLIGIDNHHHLLSNDTLEGFNRSLASVVKAFEFMRIIRVKPIVDPKYLTVLVLEHQYNQLMDDMYGNEEWVYSVVNDLDNKTVTICNRSNRTVFHVKEEK